MTSVKIFRTGPITEGEIDFAPLTILAGPNGSGKSYAAMVLHSLNGEGGYGNINYFLSRSFENELEDGILDSFEDVLFELREEGISSLSSEIYNDIIDIYYRFIFEERLNDRLESVFSSDLNNLIKEGHRGIRFDIENELGYSRVTYFSTYDGLELDYVPESDSDPVLVDPDRNEEKIRNQPDDVEMIPVRVDKASRAMSPTHTILNSIFNHIQSRMDLQHRTESHYLPAGRAGLLQSHEVVTAGAFNRLSDIGIEPIEVPAFSGVVSSYLSQIVELNSLEPGDLSHLSQKLEEETLDGRVVVEQSDNKPHPKITFKRSDREFRLHLASTSVSELAPLILYTRYVLSEGSTVIIEEPEAHLHPENQRQVAYFIARLVRAGVRVVVTTHSDFFIEQLNNCIRISQVDEDLQNESELDSLPSLPPEDVAVHVFQSDEDEYGYKIDQVDVSGLDGIPTSEFDRVSDELYGESYKIDSLIEKSMNK